MKKAISIFFLILVFLLSAVPSFAEEESSIATGWQYIDDAWYWFDEDGVPCTGWIKPGSAWYYLDADGRMVTGWLKYNQKWYYLNPGSGSMKEGWLWWNNGWYYLCPGSGAMAHSGWYTIDGKRYCFFDSGKWNQNAELWKLTSIIDKATANAGWYVSVFNGSLSQTTINKLNADMLALWNAGADVGFVLLDVYTGAVLTGNPNKWFYGASTMKGPFACAIGLKAAGRAPSYQYLIEPMIAQSDNNAYLSLKNQLGDEILRSYMADAGVTEVSAYTIYPDEKVKDLAELWTYNYEYFCSEAANVNWIRPFFLHTKNSFMDAAIGYKHTVYSKAGWLWGPEAWYKVYNDAGIVMKAGAPYILVVLSNGLQGTHDAKLQKFVRDLDEAHYELTGTGWIYENEIWYYKGATGSKMTGWQYIKGSWYYFNSNGEMQTGWQKIGGYWYYLRSSGAMATGWLYVDDNWYYLETTGKMATGWKKLNGKWYYLDSSGALVNEQ